MALAADGRKGSECVLFLLLGLSVCSTRAGAGAPDAARSPDV